MNSNLELKLKAKKIKLVAFDVDGVMTDGSLTFNVALKCLESQNYLWDKKIKKLH